MTWQIRPSCTSTWRGEGGATPLKMALKRIVSEGDSLIMAATRFPFRLWTLGELLRKPANLQMWWKHRRCSVHCEHSGDLPPGHGHHVEHWPHSESSLPWLCKGWKSPFFKIIIKSISGLCSLLLKWPVCWNKRSLRWDQRIQLPRQIHCQGKCGLEFSQKCRVTRNSLKTEKYISSRQLQKTLSHGRTTWSRCRHFCFGSLGHFVTAFVHF